MSETIIEEWRPEEADASRLDVELGMLAGVLSAVVHEGASVSFVLPFSPDDARAFWRDHVLPNVKRRTRRVLVARWGDEIVGTVQLDLGVPPNQRHRAEVAKLLVHPKARRRGIARSLMDGIEQVARSEGRTLLTLDTVHGGMAEPLYLAIGFVLAGVIPRYARGPLIPDLDDASIMYKELASVDSTPGQKDIVNRAPAEGDQSPVFPGNSRKTGRVHATAGESSFAQWRRGTAPFALPRSSVLHVLVYSDSLTWGIIPNTRNRLPFEARWPGVLECALHDCGRNVRIIEDCLNGRRTVWDDPFKPGRNGLQGLAQRIESQSPLSLVILMLGTNDFQFSHPHNNAWAAAQGVAALVNEIRRAPLEPEMPVPPVLVVCPPPIREPKGAIAAKFPAAHESCQGLADAYREVSARLGCHFFEAGSVTPASRVDGIHLDADQHLVLGKALATVVSSILTA